MAKLLTQSSIFYKTAVTLIPAIFHPQVESGTEELGLLGNASETRDPVILIYPVENKHKNILKISAESPIGYHEKGI